MNKIFIIIVVVILIIQTLIIYKFNYQSNENINESFQSDFGLPNIYIINMDINKDRINILNKYFIKQKIKYIRFPAYNGKLLNEKYLINENILNRKHSLLKGQLGCAYSHYKLLNQIKKRKESISLILEDDVIIPNNFKTKLNYILNNLPKKWDIIYLGGCNVYGEKINKTNCNINSKCPNMYITPVRYNNTYNLCAHAYLVNKNSIVKVINSFTPFYRPIDSQLRDNFKKIEVFYINPNIIIQNKDIRSTRRDLDGLEQSKYWKHNQTNFNVI